MYGGPRFVAGLVLRLGQPTIHQEQVLLDHGTSRCGETIYYGQRTRISVTRQQYHTYSCPTPEMNAILRVLAAEYEDSEIYAGRDTD